MAASARSAATAARSALHRAPLADLSLPHLASSSHAEAAWILLRSATVELEARMPLHSAAASAARLGSSINQAVSRRGHAGMLGQRRIIGNAVLHPNNFAVLFDLSPFMQANVILM